MKKHYHHGNLKNDLIEKAIYLLETEGLAALSLRRVARDAGVSQAAPYSHFKDKRALLTAVANEGYRRFGERMKEEANATPGNYTSGLGKGYVFFALENPALFFLMFSGELGEHVDFQQIGNSLEDSYQILIDAMEEHPLGSAGINKLDTAIGWSLVHGLATLLLDKRLSPQDYGFSDVNAFIDQVLDGMNRISPANKAR